MRRNQHRLIAFDTLNCTILEFVKCKLVLLRLNLRASEISGSLVASRRHIFMRAVVVFECLDFVVVQIVAKFVNICWRVVLFLIDSNNQCAPLFGQLLVIDFISVITIVQ